MKDLTIIIPIHKLNESIEDMFDEAVKNCLDINTKGESTIMLVGPNEVVEKLSTNANFKKIKNTIVVKNDKADFSAQINKAIEKCKTKYFTILEIDDKFTKNFIKNVEIYTKAYPEYFCYIPLNEVHDFNNLERGAIGYINEAFWASSYSEEIGKIDEDSLKDYLSVNVTGAIFNKDTFKELGGLKESIKISFWHEFLLRALHKEKSIYVMPKVGYIHVINRPDSLTDNYNQTISKKEGEWWINLAQEEYYYSYDRNKKYEDE